MREAAILRRPRASSAPRAATRRTAPSIAPAPARRHGADRRRDRRLPTLSTPQFTRANASPAMIAVGVPTTSPNKIVLPMSACSVGQGRHRAGVRRNQAMRDRKPRDQRQTIPRQANAQLVGGGFRDRNQQHQPDLKEDRQSDQKAGRDEGQRRASVCRSYRPAPWRSARRRPDSSSICPRIAPKPDHDGHFAEHAADSVGEASRRPCWDPSARPARRPARRASARRTNSASARRPAPPRPRPPSPCPEVARCCVSQLI